MYYCLFVRWVIGYFLTTKKEEYKVGIVFGTRLTGFVNYFEIVSVRKDVDMINEFPINMKEEYDGEIIFRTRLTCFVNNLIL